MITKPYTVKTLKHKPAPALNEWGLMYEGEITARGTISYVTTLQAIANSAFLNGYKEGEISDN